VLQRDLVADSGRGGSARPGRRPARHPPEPLRGRIYAEILEATVSLTDLLNSDLDDAAFLRKAEDSIAVTELKNLNLTWVTADPLPYVSSPYVCLRSSAARSRSLPAEAVLRLLDDDESIVRTTMARHAPHLVDPATAERIDRDFRPDETTKCCAKTRRTGCELWLRLAAARSLDDVPDAVSDHGSGVRLADAAGSK
jgi:hypothetical protein